MRFGYACQSLTLGSTTRRTLRLANVADAQRVRSVIATNLSNLETILAELRYLARLLTLLQGTDLVLHLRGVCGDRRAAMTRFTESLCGEHKGAIPTWGRAPKVHLSSQDAAKERGARACSVAPQNYAAHPGRDAQ